MSIRPTYTLLEYKHMLGQTFLFMYGKRDLAANTTENIVVIVGDKSIVVDELLLTGDLPTMSWRWFENTTLTSTSPGIVVPEISRNTESDYGPSGTTVYVNPTIDSPGVSILPNVVQVNGLVSQNGRSTIERPLIRQPYTLSKDTIYLLKVKNEDLGFSGHYELVMNIHMLND